MTAISDVAKTVLVLLALVLSGCVTQTPPVPDTGPMTPEERLTHYREELKTASPSRQADLKIALRKHAFMLSMSHMDTGKALMEEGRFPEAMEAFIKSLESYPGNQRAAQLLDEARDRKASVELAARAETLFPTDPAAARTLAEKAFDLYPDNINAADILAATKGPAPSASSLTFNIDEPVSFRFKNTPVEDVFDIISKMTDVNFLFDKDIKKFNVTLFVKDVTLDHFLDMLLKTNDLAAKEAGARTVLIYQATEQKLKEYQDLQIQTFYLSNLKAKEASELLKRILKLKDVTDNKTLNTVTVRADSRTLDTAAQLIKANDLPESEVVLDVEFLEVSTKKQEEVGLSFSDSITFGVSTDTSTGIDLSGFASFYDIKHLTSKDYYLSLPTAKLNLLKQDGDTRLLAKPSIRVTNNQEATILIGERIPLRSNRTVETDGRITYDFTYQDVGIKLTATPEINKEEIIRLTLKLEVSALGDNVGTLEDPQYAITTRSAHTTLTVSDNDTVIIGGLTQQEGRKNTDNLPVLSDIPMLGRLFTSTADEDIARDLLMTIKPLVIRSSRPAATARIWSGSGSQTHDHTIVEAPQEHFRNNVGND